MPKFTTTFPDRIEFMTTQEMRVKLIALAFLTNSGKSYSRIARHLMHQAIDSAIEALDPKRRKAYDEILASVTISETHKPKE
jgi:hypothetical protein